VIIEPAGEAPGWPVRAPSEPDLGVDAFEPGVGQAELDGGGDAAAHTLHPGLVDEHVR
jgi:hypothetical protein